MSNWKLSVGVLAIAIAATSCQRKEKEDIGGKGGNATLRITPMHHSTEIDSSIVYIKYNASDAAAFYDDSAWCVQVGGKPVATFTGLRKGKYYLYSTGFDPGVLPEPAKWWNVKGGVSYTIQTEQALDITVPVTEAH